MTSASSLTERYLDAALRGVPAKQRDDVARELRSSVAEAVEDRVAAGEDPVAAETSVLEDLGDPTRFAAGITGRPLHLIGPDLFVEYRRLLTMLLSISLPIVGLVQLGVALSKGDDFIGAIIAGLGGAWMVGIHIFFWVTATFAAFERFDAMRDARDEITGAAASWTVDRLPPLERDRVSAGETVGEVVTILITLGGLLFVNGVLRLTDASGAVIPFLNPDLPSWWVPFLVGALLVLAGISVVVFFVGRWTVPLAIACAVADLAFAIPLIAVSLAGFLVNPAFAEAIGWPPLADGNGVAMISLALTIGAVTTWEIVGAFRRALRARTPAAGAAASAR